MDRFSRFNPKVSFSFFVFVILLVLLNFNPFFLSVSLIAGLIYNIMLQGNKAFKTFFTIFAKKSYVSKSKGYSIRDRKKITNTTRVMWLDFVLRKSSC